MTNEEKAKELSDIYMPDTGFTREDIYDTAMEMAGWKDKQFNETLKRANESVTKSHEEGAKIERERIIEKACEFIKGRLEDTKVEDDYREIMVRGVQASYTTVDELIEDFKKSMEEKK